MCEIASQNFGKQNQEKFGWNCKAHVSLHSARKIRKQLFTFVSFTPEIETLKVVKELKIRKLILAK